MCFTIRIVFENGEVEKFSIWSSTLNGANESFFNHCHIENGGAVSFMELKQGRKRIAFQKFEKGLML